MPFVLEMCRLFTLYTGLPALTGICAPFSLAAGIRGYINLVRDMRNDPTFVHALLKFVTKGVLIPWAREIKEATRGKVILFAADAWASPPNIDQHIQEEFVVPYVKQLREATGVSSQGQWGQSFLPDAERFLESQLEMGMPVTGLDPDAHRLGPERFKDFALRHQAPLTLGISPLLLRDGPPEAIVQRIRRYIEVGAPGGRFFLFLNSIPADTPPVHVLAAVGAAQWWGRYPLEERPGGQGAGEQGSRGAEGPGVVSPPLLRSSAQNAPPPRTLLPFQDFLRHRGMDGLDYFLMS